MLQLITGALRLMVSQYRRYTQLSDAELRLLPLFAKALPLYTVRFFNIRNSEAECLDHIQWFSYQLDQKELDQQVLKDAIEQVIIA